MMRWSKVSSYRQRPFFITEHHHDGMEIMEHFIKLKRFNEMTKCRSVMEQGYIEWLMSLLKIASNGTSVRYTN